MTNISKAWLTKAEIGKILSLDIDQKRMLLVKTMYSGAFRVTEALRIKPSHLLDHEDKFFILLEDQKTDKKNWEIQPVDRAVYRELERYIELNDVWHNQIIFTAYKGTAYSKSYVWEMFNALAKGAGINKVIGTHALRRSRATHLLDETNDIYFVSKFLRHKSIVTTLRYLKISKAKMYERLEKISSPTSMSIQTDLLTSENV